MSYQQVRRRRRRRILVALVVLIVIAAVVYAVTRVQSDKQMRREYLDQALAFAASEADLAGQFTDMVLRLEEIGRPAMVATLDDLQEGAAAVARDLEEVAVPPGELAEADSFLDIAAVRWRDGISRVREGLIGLSEAAMDEESLAVLEQGLLDLGVGDSAFAQFLDGLDPEELTSLGLEFPAVAFVPAGGETLFSAGSLADRLVLTPGLTAAENLAVADLHLNPEPIGEQIGLPVVPVADSLDADVTVANRGTVRAVGVTVVLELLAEDAGVDHFEVDIPVLEPGSLTTVSFTNLPAEPGKIYEIVVTLSGEDDDPSDDRLSFIFIRNSEA